MNKPDVSIVIPVHNTGEEANKLVKKILNYYKNMEIVLIDDGSTDDSLDLLKKIKDERVRVYHQKNSGPSGARNTGIEKAKGNYLLFIDSDDEITKDFIPKMLAAMDQSTAMAVSGVKYCKLDQNTKENVYLDNFPYKNNEDNKNLMLRSLLHDGRMYPAFNKIFQTKIIKEHHLKYDESMNFGEDTKFVMDYLSVADGKIKFILEPLYIYYSGTSTSTARKTQGNWNNWKKCYANLKKWIGKNPTWEQRKTLILIYLKWRASWAKAKMNS